jgi:hypothetical protein
MADYKTFVQRVFFDVTVGGSPVGRIVMELTDK